MQRSLAAAALLLCTSGAVLADEHALALRVGVLGLGLEYTYAFTDRWAVRAGVNGSSFGFDAEESGIDYDFDVVWDSLSVAVDIHPFRSAFRVSAGVLRNDNRLDAESRPAESITVGGNTYTPAQVGTLLGTVGFDDTAPFLGVGWDWSRGNRLFGMSLDVGVLDLGTPTVSLRGTGSLLGDPAFEADIRAEEAELQDSVSDLDLTPYVSLGFVFRF
jgi:hypothetical protein